MRDLSELKRLAEAATQYEWRYHQHHHPISDTYSYGVCTDEYFGEWIATTTTAPARENEEADARFIAAANPITVLALLTVIEHLQADNRSKNGSMKAFGEQIAKLQRAVKNRDKMLAKLQEENAELRVTLAWA